MMLKRTMREIITRGERVASSFICTCVCACNYCMYMRKYILELMMRAKACGLI